MQCLRHRASQSATIDGALRHQRPLQKQRKDVEPPTTVRYHFGLPNDRELGEEVYAERGISGA